MCLKRRDPRPSLSLVPFLLASPPARRPAEAWFARIREIIVSVVVVVAAAAAVVVVVVAAAAAAAVVVTVVVLLACLLAPVWSFDVFVRSKQLTKFSIR